MIRSELELLPEFTAELEEIRKNGISPDLIYKIIQKHMANAAYNRRLHNRYMAIYGGVPIFSREDYYEEEEKPINNRINNDYFGEIVDFETGYFAGEPISYSYSKTDEAEKDAGGEKEIDAIGKALTDFLMRSNMRGVDMETTKNACIYGYSGRLFYIDPEGNERARPVHGYETVVLSDVDISEPEYALRYYKNKDLQGTEYWIVDFYDNKNITTYRGELQALEFVETRPHLFDYCPLQGIAHNAECMGSAEKVISLIDDYDKVLSDNSNEIESFVHAYLIFEGLRIDEDVLKKGKRTGSFEFPAMGTQQGRAYWLTKQINDAFTEHHLQRVEDNIYRFSRTPNLADETFGTASGVALRFKLHGLETKCATFEASVLNSAKYMWKVLCSSWNKKGIKADPLQFVMEFHRNFPLDKLSEAQTAQAQIAAGLPKEWVYSQMSDVDDVDYILEMIEKEREEIADLYPSLQEANEASGDENNEENEEEQE